MADPTAEFIQSWETVVEKAFGIVLLGMGAGLGVYKSITTCQEMRRVRRGTATGVDEEALDGYIGEAGVSSSSVAKQLASLLKILPRFRSDAEVQQEIYNLEAFAERRRSVSPPRRERDTGNGEGPSRPPRPAPMPASLPHRPAQPPTPSSGAPRKKLLREMDSTERAMYPKGDDRHGWYRRNGDREKVYCRQRNQ